MVALHVVNGAIASLVSHSKSWAKLFYKIIWLLILNG